MKKYYCPYCNCKLKPSLNIFKNDPRPHIIKCQNCGKTLRKKFSIYIVIELLAMAIPLANIKTHWLFAVIGLILLLIYLYTYIALPYVPYDDKKDEIK